MKILITVEFYEPRKCGSGEVVRQIAERLVEKGHDVCVATSFDVRRKKKIINGVRVEDFKIFGNKVEGIVGKKSEIDRYKNLLINGGFYLIFNYAAQVWTTDLMLGVLDKIKSRKVLAPVGYSRLNDPQYRRYFEDLSEYLKKYDKLVYHSSSYQDYVYGEEKGLGGKAVIIPNGASCREFSGEAKIDVRKELGIRTKYLLISVSNHYRAKGHHFVIRAFKKLKREDATLLVVGSKFVSSGWKKWGHFVSDYLWCWLSSIFGKNIILMDGSDRNFVVSVYKQADLFLFGSEVECAPLVMYESFASKTPFVSTPVGNVLDCKDIVEIVKSENEMACVANNLLDDKKKRLDLAQRAFETWRERYTWEKIVSEYENLFLRI